MALRKRTSTKTTRRKKANPTTTYAEQVTSYMMEELGIESLDTVAEVCTLMLKAIELQADPVEEEEEEEAPVRKSTRRRRNSGTRSKKRSSEPDEMQLGRVSLWENNGNGNFEFNGNIQFRFDGGRIKSSKDVDLEVSVLLFEPSDDANYLYSGILTEKVEGRTRRKQKSPVVGRIYVYDPGSSGRKSGMEAFAYLYLIDPDDEGDNVDPEYLLDFLPEDLIPEEGAFAKVLIYENDSDNEDAPLFTGKVVLPGELETNEEEEEEEEEPAPRRRRNARSKRTTRTRDKGEATTGSRRRKARSSRKTSRKSALDFSGAADMPDVYDDEDEDLD